MNTDELEPADDSDDGPYDWYVRGLQLLQAGSAAAAEQVLARAAAAEPESRSVLEALGRAQFDARLGDLRTAVEHLALAAAMRPDLPHYGRELRMARARLEGAP